MATFKCKMCGGDLEIAPDHKLCICEYCGTQQTLPRLDSEKKENLYARANHMRRSNDFDKAMSIYETILNEDTSDAEAYWSIVLCRYGIEYVEDPATRKRVPTCHRTQFASIFTDPDYKKAVEYGDTEQKSIYEAEATVIDQIQKDILAISQKEDPFDVFICYKETDEYGQRTVDSVLAQDIYFQLVNEGYKVFFSRITLEDKLGQAYEPYIFSALNTAKVMIVVGTKPEFFNAVWVKNEWSRFLAMIKAGEKKILIPAYRDMDPYSIPEEFSHLQAQDMSKIGFVQDLMRGIAKVLKKTEEPVISAQSAGAEVPIIKRAFMTIEDGNFEKADELLENALNLNPENAEIYVAQLLISLRLKTFEQLEKQTERVFSNPYYQKALRFADPKLKARLEKVDQAIADHLRKEEERKEQEEAARRKLEEERIEQRKKEDYLALCKRHENLEKDARIFDLISAFDNMGDYQDCAARADALRERVYHDACLKMNKAKSIQELSEVEAHFWKLRNYKDSVEKSNSLVRQIKRRKRKQFLMRACGVFATCIILVTIFSICRSIYNSDVNRFLRAYKAGDYSEANAIWQNSEDTASIQKSVMKQATGIYSAYLRESIAAHEVTTAFDNLQKCAPSDELNELREQFLELDKSRTAYVAACAAEESGSYTGAFINYKNVIEEDENFKEAQKKIEEILPLYKQEVIRVSEEKLEEKLFSVAQDTIENAIELVGPDQDLENQLAKINQAIEENERLEQKRLEEERKQREEEQKRLEEQARKDEHNRPYQAMKELVLQKIAEYSSQYTKQGDNLNYVGEALLDARLVELSNNEYGLLIVETIEGVDIIFNIYQWDSRQQSLRPFDIKYSSFGMVGDGHALYLCRDSENNLVLCFGKAARDWGSTCISTYDNSSESFYSRYVECGDVTDTWDYLNGKRISYDEQQAFVSEYNALANTAFCSYEFHDIKFDGKERVETTLKQLDDLMI